MKLTPELREHLRRLVDEEWPHDLNTDYRARQHRALNETPDDTNLAEHTELDADDFTAPQAVAWLVNFWYGDPAGPQPDL